MIIRFIQGGPSASGKNYVDGNSAIAPGWNLGVFIRTLSSFYNNEQNDSKNQQ